MASTPNILELCLTLDTGGLERVVVNLSNALSAGGSARPCVCTLGRTATTLLPESLAPEVEWLELGGPPHFHLGTACRLAHAARRRGITLVHAHGTQPLVYALFVSMLTGARVVFTKHSSFEDLHFFERRRFFNALACWRVRHFLGVSDEATRVLKRVFAPAAPRCATVVNGTALPTARSTPLAREPDASRPFVITTVCRLSPEKDPATLLRAFAQVAAVQPHVRLWIVGDGVQGEWMRRLAGHLGITPRVRFWGFSREVPELLSCSDLFVNSSLTEGISLAILEAMSVGLPVVATAVGGTPSLVQAPETGLLVSPQNPPMLAQAILRLMADPPLRARMAAEGRRAVQTQWTLERMVERYHEIYLEALGCPKAVAIAAA